MYGGSQLAFALDTDDTYVEPAEPLPVNRKLFLERPVLPEPAVDLVTPKKEPQDEVMARPVAAPSRTSHMKALKRSLAENAKRIREQKLSSAPAAASEPEAVDKVVKKDEGGTDVAAMAENADKGGEEEPIFTRRMQLELRPDPKKKTKAAKAKAKPADEAKIEPASADGAGKASKPKAAAKSKPGPKPGVKRAAKAKAIPRAEPIEEPKSKRRLLGRSSAPADMEPREVMDILHEPGNEAILDIVMQMVEAMKSKGEPPSIDKPAGMPQFNYWDLSKYWTRTSLGVIFKAPDKAQVYCGTFSAAKCGNMWVAIEAVSAFVPRATLARVCFLCRKKIFVALRVLRFSPCGKFNSCITSIYIYIYIHTYIHLIDVYIHTDLSMYIVMYL